MWIQYSITEYYTVERSFSIHRAIRQFLMFTNVITDRIIHIVGKDDTTSQAKQSKAKQSKGLRLVDDEDLIKYYCTNYGTIRFFFD